MKRKLLIRGQLREVAVKPGQPLTAEECLGVVKSYLLQVTPVIHHDRSVTWNAGYRVLSSDGYGNHCPNDRFVFDASSPEEAVGALLQSVPPCQS